MADTIKKKPASEKVNNPEQPQDVAELFNSLFGNLSASQKQQVFDSIGLNKKASSAQNKQLLNLLINGTQKLSDSVYSNEATLAPQYANLYMGILDQTDPEFRAVRDKLGAQVSGDLDKGYNLGDDLSREIEQDVRKGQDARGNWYGEAPVSAEALMKASQRIQLYQQRQQAASNFLSGTSATDKMGEIRGSTAATQFFQPQMVQTNYNPTGVAMQAAGIQYANQQNYFQNLLAATNQRNNATNTDYDYYRQRYMYLNPTLYTGGSSGGGGGWSWGGAGGGALSGAATGAAAGTMVYPGIGTAIGAGVGAIAGGVSGGMSGG